jgi:AraC-like DNA-binding protein
MKIIQKSQNLIVSNKVLDQYHQEIESVIQTKSLYLRPTLCLDDLSIETGIPIEYVKQVLSEKLHLTFFEFISKYKIAEAKRLLTKINNDHFSISNIAIESGFSTDESFIALFKKHTNMSPEKYRIKYFNIDPDSNSPVKD